VFRRLWADDAGSVIATEYVLLASVVTFGAAAGLVEIRDAVNTNLADVGRSIRVVGVVPDDVRRMVASVPAESPPRVRVAPRIPSPYAPACPARPPAP
jgi:Flp pilus assembly pilin Flp